MGMHVGMADGGLAMGLVAIERLVGLALAAEEGWLVWWWM